LGGSAYELIGKTGNIVKQLAVSNLNDAMLGIGNSSKPDGHFPGRRVVYENL